MTVSLDLLDGTSKNANAVLRYLDEDLIPQAVDILNHDTLPLAVPLFPDDVLPSNQRNLTDFRTRIGVLLEYELAKAITLSLPTAVRQQGLHLTYVVANQFPDLAFRAIDGQMGIRFEVKAIQTTAEEKSANFATLVKEIRKGKDFVVVLLWEWKQHQSRNMKFPRIDSFFVMDAYELARMRDCHWLNNPPANLQSARQGFDLTFAINAQVDSYNKEEGNYGKLMRIFDANHEAYLDDEVRQGITLQVYYRFSKEAARLGLMRICEEIAGEAARRRGGACTLISDTLPVSFTAGENRRRLLIIGNQNMPNVDEAMKAMRVNRASVALLLNEKFRWTVRNRKGKRLNGGQKPEEAKEWVRKAR